MMGMKWAPLEVGASQNVSVVIAARARQQVQDVELLFKGGMSGWGRDTGLACSPTWSLGMRAEGTCGRCC